MSPKVQGTSTTQLCFPSSPPPLDPEGRPLPSRFRTPQHHAFILEWVINRNPGRALGQALPQAHLALLSCQVRRSMLLPRKAQGTHALYQRTECGPQGTALTLGTSAPHGDRVPRHAWQGITASIPTLVNNTVGCLAGARYADGSDANVAVIMGSGRPLPLSCCIRTSVICWLAVDVPVRILLLLTTDAFNVLASS